MGSDLTATCMILSRDHQRGQTENMTMDSDRTVISTILSRSRFVDVLELSFTKQVIIFEHKAFLGISTNIGW